MCAAILAERSFTTGLQSKYRSTHNHDQPNEANQTGCECEVMAPACGVVKRGNCLLSSALQATGAAAKDAGVKRLQHGILIGRRQGALGHGLVEAG